MIRQYMIIIINGKINIPIQKISAAYSNPIRIKISHGSLMIFLGQPNDSIIKLSVIKTKNSSLKTKAS